MKKTLHILLLGLLLSTSAAFAQVVTIPYTMSFEDSEAAEWANWVMNPGPASAQCEDKWVRDSKLRSDGQKALYIVSDSTENPIFGTSACLQFVYRDFELPQGQFDMTFDWLNVGSASAKLHVGYVSFPTGAPSTAANQVVALATSGVLPNRLVAQTKLKDKFGQDTWKAERITLDNPTGNQTLRVFFAWSNTGATTRDVGAAIDNIQITDHRYVPPTSITATTINCDSVMVCWQSSHPINEIQYRKVGSTGWSTRVAQSGATCVVLEGLSEGSYVMRVRGTGVDAQGETYYSAYTYLDEPYLLYCAENHCMRYFDLEDPSVTCYYGTTNGSYSTSKQEAYRNIGIIDYGPDDIRSRHTVVWDQTATDPRTNNQLKLVPNGMMASVRLGNWDVNSQAEGITYQYVVDSTRTILLLKYAVVLEDPDHGADDQPRFVLEVLDQNDQPVPDLCGEYNFAANKNRPGWHTAGSGYDAVTWKDWSTVGVRLDNYIGQVVKIRVTTYDCFWSGHYGYAYFTLDCASATISAMSCGDDTRLQASAPDGFTYRWTDPLGNVLGTTRDIDIQTTDSFTYTCTLADMENPDCTFDLQVKALPRFPIVNLVAKYDPQDCQNRYVFTNKSYVQTRFDGVVEDHFDQDVDNYEWFFSDDNTTSNQKDVVHVFPSDGGTYYVTLAGWLAESADKNSACYKDTTIEVHMPKLEDVTVTVDTMICQGDFIEIGNVRYSKDTVVTDHTISRAGCDSTSIVTVKVNPTYLVNVADSICFGDELCYGEDCWDGIRNPWRRSLKTVSKCDSIILVDVTMMPEIKPVVTIHDQETMKDTAYIELDTIQSSGFVHFEVRDENGVKMENLRGLIPGVYTLHYINEIACEVVDTAELALPCLSAIYQRWDDVLSMMNDSIQKLNNYGHSFDYVTFMWVKDGMPLVNETRSYYYEEGGLTGSYYTCIVTDATGKERQICEYEPVPFTPTSGQVQVRKQMKNGSLYIEVNGVLYDTTGARIN